LNIPEFGRIRRPSQRIDEPVQLARNAALPHYRWTQLMKKVFSTLPLSLVAAGLATTAHAVEVPDRGFYVGPYGGVHLSLDDWALGDLQQGSLTVNDGGVIGLRLGVGFFQWLGLELNAGYIPTTASNDERIHALETGLNVYFQATSGRVGVYAGGGGGMYAALSGATGDDTDWQANVGIGVRIMTTDWMDVRIDARHLFTDGLDDNAYNMELSLGLEFWAWREVDDTDRDGILDLDDACPTVPGVASAKGCPDRDGDGIRDDEDACPDVPGVASAKGCPDRDKDGIQDKDDRCADTFGKAEFKGCPDSDGDGIPDVDDKCPQKPGIPALAGCPDQDGDGIADDDDKCPTKAGPAKTQGCPDRDGDGVLDDDDKCPDVPGVKEEQGCLPAAVQKFTGAIEGILFQTGSAKIKKQSFVILDKAVAVLKQYDFVKLRIEGHTDSDGPDDANMKLSKARAESVRDYITSKGVAAERLQAEGFGETKPKAPNDNKKNKALNRRIEFTAIN
jgi:outer membrane protein OmpA-like peptidoglycan-associated protein